MADAPTPRPLPAMMLGSVEIADTFAEGFRMWATRLVVTADDAHWLEAAAHCLTGYGTSVIACDAEVGRQGLNLEASRTPDGRLGQAFLIMAFNAQALGKALPKRVGQCLMTCPTTAVYDGLPQATDRLPMGQVLRYFGDGYQRSKVIGSQRYWRVPVMEGEFVCQEAVGTVRAIGGGNFLIHAVDGPCALRAARVAVQTIATHGDVITPFPGGVVRSGSKVGSRYKGLVASTNHGLCPTLRGRLAAHGGGTDAAGLSQVHPDAECVLEVVVNGLDQTAVAAAMRAGIVAACATDGVVAISAGNYGGRLGKFHFHLREVMAAAGSQ